MQWMFFAHTWRVFCSGALDKKLLGGGVRQKMWVLRGKVLITSKSEEFGKFDGGGREGGPKRLGLGLPIQNICPGGVYNASGHQNRTGEHFLAKTNPTNSCQDEKSAEVFARKCSPVQFWCPPGQIFWMDSPNPTLFGPTTIKCSKFFIFWCN